MMLTRRVLYASLALATACGLSTVPSPAELLGTWGGTHISLDVTPNETAVELDCAHGTVQAPFSVDTDGRFDLPGEFVREHGGPIREGEPLDKFPARYRGTVTGNRMELRIDRADSAATLGTFTLRQGDHGIVFKCL
jgi:hypothetical protein